jgi:hypothetical protein
MSKILKAVLILAVVSGIGFGVYKWYEAQAISVEAFSLVPADAIYCITTNDPISTWKNIAGSGAWTHLQQNPYFAALTASANSLDSLIRDNQMLFDLIGSRSLIVSTHMTAPKEHDFLFLVDLQKVSGIKFLNEYLTGFSTEGFSIRKEKHGEYDIVVLADPVEKTNLYISLPGSYLLASYSKSIITASLDAQQGANLLSGGTFIKPANEEEIELESGGMLQFYLNYSRLPDFMTCYTSGKNEYVSRLSQALQTSNLSFTIDGDMMKANGTTYVNDSVESYLKTLAVSGKAPTEIAEVAPVRTAFYLALGFKSFSEFFSNFESNIQQDVAEYKTYRENLEQVENYLGIDLQENLISWIGDEVAMLEIQSSGKGLDNETALILKADNTEKARKDLAHIEKMVRRKTPVKFKSVEHRGHTINYVSMKGLFKVLLGKFFARYDKPYYTIINNFVIFSNHPQALKSIIDDYLDKRTLDRSDEFRTFRKNFEDESAVFVYLNTPVLFNTMKKLADQPTRVSMDHNRDYIVCFRQVGFQLIPGEGGFQTLFAEQFVQPEVKTVLATADTLGPDSLKHASAEEAALNEQIVTEQPDPDVDPMALPYIYVQNVNASEHSGYFPDSTLQFKVSLKNGFKDGLFTQYHANGEVKMKGHFREDKRDGVWRLYDESGKLIMRRTYEEDQVTKQRTRE